MIGRGGIVASLLLFAAVACARPTPKALEEARRTLKRANDGPAKNAASSELQEAERTLAQAEASFVRGANPRVTEDLAYVAERQAQLAEAHAGSVLAEKRIVRAGDDIEALERERTELDARRKVCR